MSEVVHSCERDRLKFSLTADGKLEVRNTETGRTETRPWYVSAGSGKPWFPRKAKSFKGLVAQADRDGDYDDVRGPRV